MLTTEHQHKGQDWLGTELHQAPSDHVTNSMPSLSHAKEIAGTSMQISGKADDNFTSLAVATIFLSYAHIVNGA